MTRINHEFGSVTLGDLSDILKEYSNDEFVKNLILSNTIMERLLVKCVEENDRLEYELEKRSNPDFFFNKN